VLPSGGEAASGSSFLLALFFLSFVVVDWQQRICDRSSWVGYSDHAIVVAPGPISPYLAGQLLGWRAARSLRRIISQPRSPPRALSTRLLIDHPLCPLEPPVSGGWRLAVVAWRVCLCPLAAIIFWWLEHAHCSWRPGPGRGPAAAGAPCCCPSRAFNHHHTTPRRSGSGVLPPCLLPRSGRGKSEVEICHQAYPALRYF
jgi:hypothetical protein